MTQTADNAPDEQNLPDSQAPGSSESSGPETVAEDREREIQRHLSQQGRELADARRQAADAQRASAAQANKIGELEANIRLMAEHLGEQQRQQAENRRAQMEAELASLPPQDRLERKIELLQGQITRMQTAAPPARPVQQQPAPPPAAPQQQGEDPSAYMQRRVREIQQEAQSEFGVLITTDEVPDNAWNTEESFYRSVMKLAASKSRDGGADVPRKQTAETQEQLRDRIRREERERLGVNSAAAPRATPAGRKKAASEDEVRGAAQSYDSRLGPKANIQRMQELRKSMG
jgi:hypothetical protein